jgi:pilus assembly protein TadC
LNLDVKVININYDKGSKILSECSTLKQYSYFVDKIRKLMDSGYSRDEAIQEIAEDNDLPLEVVREIAKEIIKID